MSKSHKRMAFVPVALAAAGVILVLPTPSSIDTGTRELVLSEEGKATLAVLAMAVLLWITEAVPFPVTGLIAMVALVITKAVPFRQLVHDGFGNHIILFMLGILIFSAAIGRLPLLRRLTMWLLFHLGHKPKIIILIVLTAGAMLSAWMSDMAVAAVLMPIAVTILKDAKAEPLRSNFGRALMISCAWGPLVGGVATPAGCGPNPLTMGFLRDLVGIDFTFLDWMAIGFPAAILMLPCAWLVLLKSFPIEDIDLRIAEEDLHKKLEEIGPVTRKEIFTLTIFLLTIFLWVFAGFIKSWTGGAIDYLEISLVSIGCACLLFLPGIEVLTWSQAEKSVGWGGIILVVTGLSVGISVYRTGAAEWIAWIAFSKIGMLHPILIIFVVVFGVCLLKVLFSSNTVTGTIIVPLLIALARNLELDPILLAIPAGVTASLAFIMITSTPTNVVPYSAGYFSIADMAKAGLWMTIAASICVTISVCIMGRLLNIVNW